MTDGDDTGTEQSVRYAQSHLTGQWYRVTEWEDVGDDTGKMVAISKEEVDESDVPAVWKGAATWKLGGADA